MADEKCAYDPGASALPAKGKHAGKANERVAGAVQRDPQGTL